MVDQDDIQVFEDARPNLLGLAYRILGTMTEAEDAVQDTFVKWAKAKRSAIDNKPAWLTTVCTRRCLDLLRSAHRAREHYVGAWLPEPIHTSVEHEGDHKLDMASSLTTAFLLMLERLTPKERAAYLLHEIFDVAYPEIADTLAIKEPTCRKLVSRAKAHIDQADIRHHTPVAQQEAFLEAFQTAVTSGATEPLAALLSRDVRLSTDGGGKVPAILEILEGRADVMAFMEEGLHTFWAGCQWHVVDINGARGVVIKHDDTTQAVASFAYDANGQATDIFIMRNPDKLAHLGAVAIH